MEGVRRQPEVNGGGTFVAQLTPSMDFPLNCDSASGVVMHHTVRLFGVVYHHSSSTFSGEVAQFQSGRITMLVISRKCGDSIRIGDDTTITILQVRGRSVRLGIETPQCRRVLRCELCADEHKPDLRTETDVEPSLP